ncbi:hypothetical protein LZ32DRAFT_353520 [Colletotrichum eremochloae]|nr:hypothetical protein LZ32DRAFT_353520 [Colletotrichum eremochloae]
MRQAARAVKTFRLRSPLLNISIQLTAEHVLEWRQIAADMTSPSTRVVSRETPSTLPPLFCTTGSQTWSLAFPAMTDSLLFLQNISCTTREGKKRSNAMSQMKRPWTSPPLDFHLTSQHGFLFRLSPSREEACDSSTCIFAEGPVLRCKL